MLVNSPLIHRLPLLHKRSDKKWKRWWWRWRWRWMILRLIKMLQSISERMRKASTVKARRVINLSLSTLIFSLPVIWRVGFRRLFNLRSEHSNVRAVAGQLGDQHDHVIHLSDFQLFPTRQNGKLQLVNFKFYGDSFFLFTGAVPECSFFVRLTRIFRVTPLRGKIYLIWQTINPWNIQSRTYIYVCWQVRQESYKLLLSKFKMENMI